MHKSKDIKKSSTKMMLWPISVAEVSGLRSNPAAL